MVDGSKPLKNAKRERFCREYVIDQNGTQAAIRAKYSPRSAYSQAGDFLKNPEIVARIKFLQAKIVQGLEITAENVIRELARLGFANMRDYIHVQDDGTAYVDLGELTREQSAAICELTTEEYTDGRSEGSRDIKRVKIKLHDKRGALVDLGRHMGIFAEDNKQKGVDAQSLADIAAIMRGAGGSGGASHGG